jgi:hypothetical protein
MIRRLHRFLGPVDHYQGVIGVGGTGAAAIGRRLSITKERNLCNLRNLWIIPSALRFGADYSEVLP